MGKKADVIMAIISALRNHRDLQLFHGGHGVECKGDWCFENESGKVTEFLTFEDLVDLVESVKPPNGYATHQRSIWLSMDSCFSGAWVEKMKNLGTPPGTWCIMTSCSDTEVSWDTPNGGAWSKTVCSW